MDDWSFIASVRFDGVSTLVATVSRPGQTFVHAVAYSLLGSTPTGLAAALALLNALAAALLARAASPLIGRWPAAAAGVVFALLPNRGSTQLWAATLPNVAALCLLLGAVAARTARWRVALAVLSVLTYEATVFLAIVAVPALCARDSPRSRGRAAAAAALPIAAAALFAFRASVKTGGRSFGRPADLVASHFGVGVWPGELALVSLAVFTVGLWSIAVCCLPQFRRGASETTAALGAGALVLGAAPFVATGFPIGTDGLLDRATLFSDVGLALLIVGTMQFVSRALPKMARAPAQAVLLFAVVALFGLSLRHDFASTAAAKADGDRFLRAFARSADSFASYDQLVVEPLPNRRGWAVFHEDFDTSAALRLADPRHRRWNARSASGQECLHPSRLPPGTGLIDNVGLDQRDAPAPLNPAAPGCSGSVAASSGQPGDQ